MASQNPIIDLGSDDGNWLDRLEGLDEDFLNCDDWFPNFLLEEERAECAPVTCPEPGDQYTDASSSPTLTQDEQSTLASRSDDSQTTPTSDGTLDPSVLTLAPEDPVVAPAPSFAAPCDLAGDLNPGLGRQLDRQRQYTGLSLGIAPVSRVAPLLSWPGLPDVGGVDHMRPASDMSTTPVLSLPTNSSSPDSTESLTKTAPLITPAPPKIAEGRRKQQKQKQQRPPKRHAPTSRSDALTADLAPTIELRRDRSGKLQGVFTVSGLSTKVRRPFTEEAREATAIARKRGVCEKCRRMKVRCEMPENPYEPCVRCSRVPNGVLRQPCIRVTFDGLALHRLGSTRDNALYEWLSKKDILNANVSALVQDHHRIYLTQGFGFEVEVSVARFQACPGDKTSYPWRDSCGRSRELELPQYYIVNMDEHDKVINDYSKKSYLVYIQRLLKGKSPLMVWTMQEAIRYACTHQSSLVEDSLRLWAGSRLTELPWTICGANTLGQSPVEELDCPRSGTIPIPPIMDTQMDHLVIKTVMNPLRQRILSQLYTKILQKRRENWYEIYLTMFVLMSNMERQFAQVLYIFDWYGMESKFGSRGNSSVSESFIHSCKSLLAFFHFACGGQTPLSINWQSSVAPSGIMTEQQTKYLQAAQTEVDRQGSNLEELKGKSIYETEMYWCHQLLLKDCQVDQQNDGEIDELKEDDYIFHWSGT